MGVLSPSGAQSLLGSIVVLNLLKLTLAFSHSKISCMQCISCKNWKGEVKTLKAERCPFYMDSCRVQISKYRFDQGCHETVDYKNSSLIVCVCTGDSCNGGNNLTAIMEVANRSAENFDIAVYKQTISDKKSKSAQMFSRLTIWIAGSLALIVLYWV